jgi:hypothetical protein
VSGFWPILLLFNRALAEQSLSEDEKLDLWSRGEHNLDDYSNINGFYAMKHRLRMGPVSYVRRDILHHRESPNCDLNGYCWDQFRGGGLAESLDYNQQMDLKIQEMEVKYGSAFMEAIERNKLEHAEDCMKSCELYYCSRRDEPPKSLQELVGATTIKSYSMGPVPPEDFADSFG